MGSAAGLHLAAEPPLHRSARQQGTARRRCATRTRARTPGLRRLCPRGRSVRCVDPAGRMTLPFTVIEKSVVQETRPKVFFELLHLCKPLTKPGQRIRRPVVLTFAPLATR